MRGAWLDVSVEMYQWEEHRHSRTIKDSSGGGSSTVMWWTHAAVWSSRLIASPTHCDRASSSQPCRVSHCTGGYSFPESTQRVPSTGACNPSSMPSSPVGGKSFARERTVLLGPVSIDAAQLRMLTSGRTVVPSHLRQQRLDEVVNLPLAAVSPKNSYWNGREAVTVPTRQGLRWLALACCASCAAL